MNEEQRTAEILARHRQILLRMMARITGYYFLLAAAFAIILALSPGLAGDLPLGGLGDIMDSSSNASVYELEEALLSADSDEIEQIVTESTRAHLARGPAWLKDSLKLVYAMVLTFLLMLPVSWVYRAIHTDSIYDHSIDATTLILPAIVAGIVTVVQHSLALAFSLAGIVAGVRFRRALSDTFDTLFILSSIGVGIAAGVKSIEIAVVLTVFFNYASILVCAFGDGLESQHVVQREIRRKNAKANKKQNNKAKSDPYGPNSML
jgi:hypothetical protein